MSMTSGHIPFPSMEEMPDTPIVQRATPSPSSVEPMNASTSSSTSPGSHITTSSSKLTSSDKLSALPPPNSPQVAQVHPHPSVARPRTSGFSMSAAKRGFRRSLDASISLPSFSATEYDIPMLSHSVGTVHHIPPEARFERRAAGHTRQHTPENGSAGRETPKQRVSFDSDGHSAPNSRGAGQASPRVRNSDPSSPPSAMRAHAHVEDRHGESTGNSHLLDSRSPSHSRSRATSPLRIFHQWSSGLHRGSRITFEEPFIPINPFRFQSQFPFCCIPSLQKDLEQGLGESVSSGAYDCDDLIPVNSIRSIFEDFRLFITDILPRELYLNFLLRLPAMYFSRVARIFEDAEVSRPDIQRMIDASQRGTSRGAVSDNPPNLNATSAQGANVTVFVNGAPTAQGHSFAPPLLPGAVSGIGLSAQVGAAPATSVMHTPLPFPDEWTSASVSPALLRFKHSWEAFIDSLLREWKTLNVVSALLASAILTIFQIPAAADDPVTRTCALLSLVCALMSLSYGCMYIVRFGTMKSMFHASRWAEQARKTKTSIWWNVWVLLATPAVWMAWAMILFLVAILSFVWRTGSVLDPDDRPPLSAHAALGPRIAITAIFALGMVYLVMIVRTLRKYGSNQGAARAFLRVGADAPVGPNGTVHHGRESSTRERNKKQKLSKTYDEEMECRGRERERSTSTHIRRKEGMESRERRANSNRGSRPSSAVPGLGLGSRLTVRDEEKRFDVEMDSKLYEDTEVLKAAFLK